MTRSETALAVSRNAPDLSVVIVTYNAAAFIGHCLDCLLASRLSRTMEILLIDNASTDDTVERVCTGYRQVRVFAETTNHGFARANNLGLAKASGRHLLLLNPDAFVEDVDAVEDLAATLDDDRNLAAVGPRLVFPDGRHQVGDAGHAPSPLSAFVHAFMLQRLWPQLPALFLTAPCCPSAGPRAVDWLCGAAMMVRREAIDRAGPLDPAFFLYGEDVEWGCRMRDRGLRFAYLPWIDVVHLHGGAQPGREPSTRWMDGIASVYRRRHPRSLWVLRLALVLGFGLRAIAYVALAFKRGSGALASASAMATYMRHALVLRGAAQ